MGIKPVHSTRFTNVTDFDRWANAHPTFFIVSANSVAFVIYYFLLTNNYCFSFVVKKTVLISVNPCQSNLIIVPAFAGMTILLSL